MASDKAVIINKDNFEEEVLKSPVPVMVDFWANWCGPCKAIAPTIDELAKESEGHFKVGKVNIDEESALAKDFNIMSIPTMITFKDGKQVEKVIGARSKADLKGMLEKYI